MLEVTIEGLPNIMLARMCHPTKSYIWGEALRRIKRLLTGLLSHGDIAAISLVMLLISILGMLSERSKGHSASRAER